MKKPRLQVYAELRESRVSGRARDRTMSGSSSGSSQSRLTAASPSVGMLRIGSPPLSTASSYHSSQTSTKRKRSASEDTEDSEVCLIVIEQIYDSYL